MSQPPPPGWSGPPGTPDAPTQSFPVQRPDAPADRPPIQLPPPGRLAEPPRPEAYAPRTEPPRREGYGHPAEPPHREPAGHPNDPTAYFRPGPAAAAARPRTSTAVWVLGLSSVAATVLGLTLREDGHTAWSSVHAWGAVAILGALLTLAPVLAGSSGLAARRAWQTAACGAGALGLYWVLFVLPSVGSNTSLLATIGAAAGIIAVWIAPGRAEPEARPTGGDGW